MDAYSPKELKKLLSSLKLRGLKVMKIESGSHVFNSIKKLGITTGKTQDLKMIKTSTLPNFDSSSTMVVILDSNAISILCCFITNQ